ncbi:NAD(P)H-binding protein [Streptomyces sp. b94]|uniref:SDR family oxidoreductase n=1 Tax=Streptomyces sp. b94 TaxID=1827634 RepID=UPI001B370AC9|nr:NAD(P)H-binding protein [Streptomyces sp. b94]MBQ1098939.1 NAD(P)H-binding protein [Streptomyces sp. b94]
MDRFETNEKTPVSEGICLLTVVSPRRDEGNSPTGVVGRFLARQLLATGRRVRVMAEPDQCGGWPDAVDVVVGSITRPLECARAFDGAETVFLAGAHPSTVQDALTLARNASARKVVVLSSHGPEYEEANPPATWFWLAIEKAVEHSGIAWTHIRPSAVMGSVIEGTYPATGSDWSDTIRADGVIREAFLDRGHYPFIHEEDLAAVVFAALWRRLGWPDGAIDVTLYALEEYGARFTELLQWTFDQRPSVRDIIGRPPRTYDDWVSENIDSFR